jgi:hypothetical protein
MRYRKLDANGDYTFGHGQADFYRDQPEAVAQAVETRLRLFTQEWFLDLSEGTPWREEVLGKYTQNAYDTVIKDRIIGTQGLSSLDTYDSSRNADTRALSVQATITTIYGQSSIETTL